MKYMILILALFSFSNCSVKYKNEVLLKCKSKIDCEKVLIKHNLKNSSKLTDTIYLIKLDDNKDAKDISKILKNDSDIEYAHPNYIKTKKRR